MKYDEPRQSRRKRICSVRSPGALGTASARLLVDEKLLPPGRVQILYSWKHSGFNVHAGRAVPPEAKADLEDLAQYMLRNPFSVEKMTFESPGDIAIYRSKLNAKINRNFEMFTPTDFLAAITAPRRPQRQRITPEALKYMRPPKTNFLSVSVFPISS